MLSIVLGDGATRGGCYTGLLLPPAGDGQKESHSQQLHIFNFKFGPCHIGKKVFGVENGKAELLPVWGRRSQRDFLEGLHHFTPRPGIWKEVEPTGKALSTEKATSCKGPGAGRSSDFQRTEKEEVLVHQGFHLESRCVQLLLAMLFLNSLNSPSLS